MGVLVLSYSHDEHLGLVLPHLTARCFVLYADKPFQFHFNPQKGSGSIEQDGRTLLLEDISTIWNRRPFPTPGYELPRQKFTRYEVRACILQSLIAAVPFNRWVNHPDAIAQARDKTAALRVARQCGLACPDWVISNEEEAILEFVKGNGDEVVMKPLVSVHEALSEIPGLLYARPVTGALLRTELSAGRVFPMFLQQRITKAADWRITMIDGSISAVRMTGCPHGTLDFRRAYPSLSYENLPMDTDVAAGLRALTSSMKLRFAAIDMVEAAETRRLYFLEVNATGQFGWMEESVGSGGHAHFGEQLAQVLSQRDGAELIQKRDN